MDAMTLPVPIPRDRWGRPMVIRADIGRAVPYTRCTTYVGCLEDTYALEKWKMRMTALGLANRGDLLLAVAAHREDKARLNEIVDQAVEAAEATAAATTGTALHSFSEQFDRGTLDIAKVPAAYRPDLVAYGSATSCFTMLDIEQFMVNDELYIGGTPDRRVGHPGGPYIFDLKTGSIDYGMGKIAMQLAVYAHCAAYDPVTGERTPVEVNRERGIIAHLPAGQGRCDLYWVDITAGWEAVQIARQVREWRKRRDLHEPFTPTAPDDPILDQIAAATGAHDLNLLWALYRGNGWTQAHTEAAAARKKLLAPPA